MTGGDGLFRKVSHATAIDLASMEPAELHREDQVREAFIVALNARPEVFEVKKEVKIDFARWPGLGGIDLAVRLANCETWTYYLEFKWAPLYETMWDAYKMLLAAETEGVQGTYLVAVQLAAEWEKPVGCAELFTKSTHDTRELIERYPKVFGHSLGQPRADTPRRLPGSFETRLVARVPSNGPLKTKYGPCFIKVASLRTLSGEWLQLDAYGQPGPNQSGPATPA